MPHHDDDDNDDDDTPYRSLAILGTMSDAGKSTITAGICRILTNNNLTVAPFKAQNMSNNSTPALRPDGGYGEIGTAQALQAMACHILPRVEMNPVLLKSGKTRQSDGAHLCSVHVLGRHFATEDYGSLGSRTDTLMNLVLKAHADLARVTNANVIVMEGAGSCTELNLMERDIVNMPLVRKLNCPWILVANIDPGGVFAQIVGTKECLSANDWDLCKAIIVNKLRGDVKYFEPGPELLQKMVNKPVFVIPHIRNLHLPEEDSLGLERRLAREHLLLDPNNLPSKHEKPVIVVLSYPYTSISSDLLPLESDSNYIVQYRRHFIPKHNYPTAVILPGSRLTTHDLNWVCHATKWGEFLKEYVENGGIVLGLCGGYQMLGLEVEGMEEEEEKGRSIVPGLGLLPVRTVIKPAECKCVRPREARFADHQEVKLKGFELHCGHTEVIDDREEGKPLLLYENGEVEGYCVGRVKGTYLHGVLQSAVARRKLLLPAENVLLDEEEEDRNVVEDELKRLAKHLEGCGLNFDTVNAMAE